MSTLTLKDAQQRMEEHPFTVTKERATLTESLGRVMSSPLYAPHDIPQFSKSLMDGWALGSSNQGSYTVAGTIEAGSTKIQSVHPHEAVAIMTGAMVPEGTVEVVRVEYSKVERDCVIITEQESRNNILSQGSVLQKGDLVLSPTKITAKEISLLAAMGVDTVEVAVPPRVGVISTGSELVAPGHPLPQGSIYDSNGPQLTAQVASLIGKNYVTNYGVVEDSPQKIEEVITKALEQCDIVLLSGGVSMGEFDYVPQVLEQCGVEKVFHKVAVKPGKPVWFGATKDRSNKKYVFGLPGNPLSCFVLFTYMVAPWIQKNIGLPSQEIPISLPLGACFQRKETDRSEYIPLTVDKGKVYPIKNRGSADISILQRCKGFTLIPPGVSSIEKGACIDVRFI